MPVERVPCDPLTVGLKLSWRRNRTDVHEEHTKLVAPPATTSYRTSRVSGRGGFLLPARLLVFRERRLTRVGLATTRGGCHPC
jgi:hypothetical protein